MFNEILDGFRKYSQYLIDRQLDVESQSPSLNITKNTSGNLYSDPIINATIQDDQLLTVHNSGKTRSYARGAKAIVTYVIDGDTIVIKFGNNISTKARLLGIDCPEIVVSQKSEWVPKANSKKAFCYGEQASSKTRKVLTNKEVFINFDLNPIDQYGRLLLIIYTDKEICLSQKSSTNEIEYSSVVKSFNYELVQNGFARSCFYKDNPTFETIFDQAQDQAKLQLKGAWGFCPFPFQE